MKIEGLGKEIDEGKILENINFTLHENEITGLIGRNGSGKTTLFRTLAGHYYPSTGDILLQGQSLLDNPGLAQQIFYIDEQDNFLSQYTLKKIGQIYQTIYPQFDKVTFERLTSLHQLPINGKYRSMSKGMQGLFQVILAICSKARYLILDEPFDGLDVIVKKNVIRLLLESLVDTNRSYIISSHNLAELESLIDRALLLKDHTITQDYRLEDMRVTARKVQMVFKTKEIPACIKENSKLLRIQGRVVMAIFENYTPELEASIQAVEPVLFEELPLSLEDLFEANLSQEADYQLFG